MKIAVLYQYYESNDDYIDNLVYFLSTAYNKKIDFYILHSSELSINIPRFDNLHLIPTKNINYDFGSISEGLASKKIPINYDYYFVFNSTVRGPFLPPRTQEAWYEIFLSLFDKDVELVGSTINIPQQQTKEVIRFNELYPQYLKHCSHIQTMAYCLSKKAMDHLLKINFFKILPKKSKLDVICDYEIRLSAEMTKNLWNLRCMLPEYNQIDYTKPKFDKAVVLEGEYGAIDKRVYFGRTASPFEVMFAKINRGAISKHKLASYTYTALNLQNIKELEDWDENKRLQSKCLKIINDSFIEKEKIDKSLLTRIYKKLIGK